ncbi:hypothetical protein [Pseudonocardia yuanmonensis]
MTGAPPTCGPASVLVGAPCTVLVAVLVAVLVGVPVAEPARGAL